MTNDPQIFPLEILEKIAQANDEDYLTQASLCLVSRALYTFTQPRLYRSFNSLFAPNPKAYHAYLRKIYSNKRLADLVESCCLIALDQNWPRSVTSALLSMHNLKELNLIATQATGTALQQDIWRDFFQSTKIPFQLDTLKLTTPTRENDLFTSLSLYPFLRGQRSIQTLHCRYQMAMINPVDLPKLRNVFINSRSWERILPGRPIKSLSLEASMEHARHDIKPVPPGSPIARTLGHVKRLRIGADILQFFSLPLHLHELENLIVVRFSEEEHRSSIAMLSQLKVLCILHSTCNAEKRKETADWLFGNVASLRDIVFSAPLGVDEKKENLCERYSRSTRKAETIFDSDWYEELVGSD